MSSVGAFPEALHVGLESAMRHIADIGGLG
jgi:hypothetical protein